MALNKLLHKELERIVDSKIRSVHPLSGGDISSVYKIVTAKKIYVCKVNYSNSALSMFQSEANGLKALGKVHVVTVPEVLHVCRYQDSAILLMDFIETGRPTENAMIQLGRSLAALHNYTSKSFGWQDDNFIGTLRQANKWQSDWTLFYTEERLQPQIKMAIGNELLGDTEVPSMDRLAAYLSSLLSERVIPSLLHGDLWSGNYLISANGRPHLIDPAVYYGHAAVDIAMTKLFGGFSNAFYQAYYTDLGIVPYSPRLLRIYQLYYLLVHLNLFGRSYRDQVMRILGEVG